MRHASVEHCRLLAHFYFSVFQASCALELFQPTVSSVLDATTFSRVLSAAAASSNGSVELAHEPAKIL